MFVHYICRGWWRAEMKEGGDSTTPSACDSINHAGGRQEEGKKWSEGHPALALCPPSSPFPYKSTLAEDMA